MKRPFTCALAIALLSLIIYASCRKSTELSSMEDHASLLILPENATGKFCFDGNIGVIGYKTRDSINHIINFDSARFTVSYGDTLFKCRNFHIHHDLHYPAAAYLTFNGEALCRTAEGEPLEVFGKFALDISYSGPGVPVQSPTRKKVEHKCESYSGLLDFIFACSCCDMVYEKGQVVGCDCVCGFMGGCVHTKTIVEEGRLNYPGSAFAGSVYKRIIQK